MTLEGCPFCHQVEPSTCTTIEPPMRYYMECWECDARGPIAKTPAEAAELWNRRDGDVE